MKKMTTKEYTIKLQIKEVNVDNIAEMYWATNICNDFKIPEEETIEETSNMQKSGAEVKIINSIILPSICCRNFFPLHSLF